MSGEISWGLCCREGDPLRVCGGAVGMVARSREYLERLHQIFPDSELVEGADGRLEFWTWVDGATGQRRRRPEGAERPKPAAEPS